MNRHKSISQYLINQTINYNNKIVDNYILDVKQDKNLSFDQQKVLIADAIKIKKNYEKLNQEIAESIKEIDFVSLNNLVKRLEEQV